MVAVVGPPGCGKSTTARTLQKQLRKGGAPCFVVNQDMSLANSRGNCVLCKEAKCNYSKMNEQAMSEKIKQVQEEVGAEPNTSSTKRSAVLAEGHNLLSLPWLVSLVDLKVWIKVPLRRCALNRVTRRAGFRKMTEPAEREAVIDEELNQGFFCDHVFASDIINLERQADVSFVLEGPDGSPPWPTRDEAADHLRLLIYDKLGIAALALPTVMPQAHPPSLRLPRKRGWAQAVAALLRLPRERGWSQAAAEVVLR